MGKTRNGMPRKEHIVQYHQDFLRQRFHDGYMHAMPHVIKCFRCGFPHVQRCHIRPIFNGGDHRLSNMILLCNGCHIFQENSFVGKDIRTVRNLESEGFFSCDCCRGLDEYMERFVQKCHKIAEKIRKELEETPLFSETQQKYCGGVKELLERVDKNIANVGVDF